MKTRNLEAWSVVLLMCSMCLVVGSKLATEILSRREMERVTMVLTLARPVLITQIYIAL